MPAGKLALRGGVGFRPHVPDGISIRSLQRYAKPRAKITDPREVEKLENDLCFAFRRYITYRAAIAPTATERRKMLTRIKTSATRLVSARNRPNAWGLLDALDAPDHGTRDLVYLLRTNPLLFKQRLRHWASASAGDPLAIAVTIETANRLAGLDIEGLVPESGRIPGSCLGEFDEVFDPSLEKSDWQIGAAYQGRRYRCEKEPFRGLARRNARSHGNSRAVTLERYRYSSETRSGNKISHP